MSDAETLKAIVWALANINAAVKSLCARVNGGFEFRLCADADKEISKIRAEAEQRAIAEGLAENMDDEGN